MLQYEYRSYLPEVGRWSTRDPLGEAGGMNLYAFVGNNPVNWVDPWGLELLINNSEHTAYYKDGVPEGTAAIPIQPGETIDVDFDGIALPCFVPGEVFKVVDGLDATINKNGTITTSGGTLKQKIGQSIIGMWWDETFLETRHNQEPPDLGWDELFEKSKKEYCKKKESCE
jgi:uncharacterized protein RhaS with RHS repeats